ncbi:ulp1 protease family, C-terminal catalytic domain-containing protein [Tanacetum coccineum]
MYRIKTSRQHDGTKWMYGMNISYPKYVNGVQSFLIVVESDRVAKGNIEIFCPCLKCKHFVPYDDIKVIEYHLLKYGFVRNYTFWSEHGESLVDNSTSSHVLNANKNNDSYINDKHGNLNEMLHDLGANDGDTNQEDLKQLFEDAEKPVYDGYDFSVLSAILELLKLKASSSWSDTSFTKHEKSKHAEDCTYQCVRRDPITEVFGKEHGGRTKGVSTILGVRTALGWVKGDKERHHIVDIKAIAENITKTVTAAFQDKFDSQKTQMDSQKTKMEGLKAIVAHLEGRERPTCLDSSCASDKFDDLEEFRVAIGKVYPTWDPTLHGSSISEGHIKVQVNTVEDAYKEIPVPKQTDKVQN